MTVFEELCKLSPDKKVNPGLCLIVDGFDIIAADNGVPLFYTGFTSYGNRVLGVLAGSDDKTTRLYHLLINEDAFDDFLSEHQSFTDLLETLGCIFVVDVPHGQNATPSVYFTKISEVPYKRLSSFTFNF